jgi:hypothetical protein
LENVSGIAPNEELAMFRFVVRSASALALVAGFAAAQTSALAWGQNGHGQCDVPALPGGVSYEAVDGGFDFSMALRSDGEVVVWGRDLYDIGDVPGLPPGTTYVQISAGALHATALRSDGEVVAWGWNHQYGQCNVLPLPPGLSYVEVAAGEYHTLARRSDGSVVGWGANYWGQLDTPVLPPGVTYQRIDAGGHHNVALCSDGTLRAWGVNSDGECDVPALPPGLAYVDIAAGDLHTLALRSDGVLIGFGRNEYGQSTPPSMPPGVTIQKIVGGRLHSVLLRSDSVITVFGHNFAGQWNVPILPAGMTYVDVASGAFHLIARVVGSALPPAIYCTAKLNSLGCLPSIGFSGTLSLSGPNDFVITASDVLNYRSGLMIWSTAEAAVPFQGGTLCIAGPTRRTPLQDSLGNVGVHDCSGTFEFALTNAYMASRGLTLGSEVCAQFWSRDPLSTPYASSLTDALHLWIGP